MAEAAVRLDPPTRVLLALSPGAVSEPPIRAAVALAERYGVALDVVQVGTERGEQISRLPFTREFWGVAYSWRRVEPVEARGAAAGVRRRLHVMCTRIAGTERAVSVLEDGDEAARSASEAGAWVLRDSAPWMAPFGAQRAFGQIITVVRDDPGPAMVALDLPRGRHTRLRVFASPVDGGAFAPVRAAVLEAAGPAGAGIEWIWQRERTGPAGAAAGQHLLGECAAATTLLVARRDALDSMGLSAEGLADRVGLAVLILP